MNKIKSIFIKKPLIFILALAFFLSFFRIWEDRIVFTDELLIEDASYGFSRGEWLITPKIDGRVDLAKPPLVYWLNSLVYYFFPPSPMLRSWLMPFFGVGILIILYYFARKLYGKKTALWSAILLVTSIPFIFFTRTANFDLPHTFFILLVLYIYNLNIKKDNDYLYFSLITASMVLGILTRSFLFAFPIVVIFLDSLIFKKDLKLLLFSILTSFVISLPWHIASYSIEPDNFVNQYLRLPVYNRVGGGIAGEDPTSPFYYLLIFAAFPPAILGLIHLVKLLSKGIKKIESVDFQILISILLIFFVLSISRSRHVWYALPIIPLLSIFTAKEVVNLKLIQKNISVRQQVIKLLLTIYLVVIPIFTLLAPFPEVEAVEASRVLKEVAGKNVPMYMWKHMYFPKTRFFPKTDIIVLRDMKELKNIKSGNGLYIFIKRRDIKDLDSIENKDVVFDGNDSLLVSIGN